MIAANADLHDRKRHRLALTGRGSRTTSIVTSSASSTRRWIS
jgi:hypothetical protein